MERLWKSCRRMFCDFVVARTGCADTTAGGPAAFARKVVPEGGRNENGAHRAWVCAVGHMKMAGRRRDAGVISLHIFGLRTARAAWASRAMERIAGWAASVLRRGSSRATSSTRAVAARRGSGARRLRYAIPQWDGTRRRSPPALAARGAEPQAANDALASWAPEVWGRPRLAAGLEDRITPHVSQINLESVIRWRWAGWAGGCGVAHHWRGESCVGSERISGCRQTSWTSLPS